MAKAATMKFKKGDGITHYFKMPLSSYSVGGTLYFAAKPEVDNDATDAAAVIDKSFDDSVVDTSDGVYAVYTLSFGPNDITGVSFVNGEKKKKYLGEFQHVPLTGGPSSFPGNDDYIEVIIYADIKRGTS